MSIPAGFVPDPADGPRDDRVLLLDRVGGGHEPARGRSSATPRTSRSTRSSGTGRCRRRSSGPSSPSSCSSSARSRRSTRTSACAGRITRSRSASPPLAEPNPTPSQRATLPFFLVAILLFIVQAVLGSVTGHFAVEGNRLFGIEIGQLLPVRRDARLAPPARGVLDRHLLARDRPLHRPGRRRPRAEGPEGARATRCSARSWWSSSAPSPAPTSASRGKLSGPNGWLVGHQGYEYIELGRVWQVALIVGMLLWLAPRVPRDQAGARGREGQGRPHAPAPLRLGHHPALLLGRPLLHAGHAHRRRRLLALVGGAPLGGELLRGVRHRRARLHPRPHRRGRAEGRRCAPRTSRSSSTSAPASSAPSTTSTSPARRSSSPRSARRSRPSRSSRSRCSASRSTRT